MAWAFNAKPVATVKIEDASTADKTYSIPGTTTANITPDEAAKQINRILDIGGLSAIVSTKMTRTQIEEVVNNG